VPLAGLDNFRTLCVSCHGEVTRDLHRRRAQSKAAKAKAQAPRRAGKAVPAPSAGASAEDDESDVVDLT
jgi:hypothetical protein